MLNIEHLILSVLPPGHWQGAAGALLQGALLTTGRVSG